MLVSGDLSRRDEELQRGAHLDGDVEEPREGEAAGDEGQPRLNEESPDGFRLLPPEEGEEGGEKGRVDEHQERVIAKEAHASLSALERIQDEEKRHDSGRQEERRPRFVRRPPGPFGPRPSDQAAAPRSPVAPTAADAEPRERLRPATGRGSVPPRKRPRANVTATIAGERRAATHASDAT